MIASLCIEVCASETISFQFPCRKVCTRCCCHKWSLHDGSMNKFPLRGQNKFWRVCKLIFWWKLGELKTLLMSLEWKLFVLHFKVSSKVLEMKISLRSTLILLSSSCKLVRMELNDERWEFTSFAVILMNYAHKYKPIRAVKIPETKFCHLNVVNFDANKSFSCSRKTWFEISMRKRRAESRSQSRI